MQEAAGSSPLVTELRARTWQPDTDSDPSRPTIDALLVRILHLPWTPSGSARVACGLVERSHDLRGVSEPLSEPLWIVFHASQVTHAAHHDARWDAWHGIQRIRYAVPSLI